jgi:hypothetical protein
MGNVLLTGLLALLAVPPVAPGWEFHDAATHDGRSLLTFRPVELADTPARPWTEPDRPPGKAYYSLLPVGASLEHGLALVWLPEAGVVWLDGDGDGRFAAAERHRLGAGPLEVSILLGVNKPMAEPLPLKRTVLLRRAADGGLRYAVRGYASGTLRLGGQDHAALLTDGNADGCFDSAAHDRVWIDLDHDGLFDPLTEQFPLGKPVTSAGKIYLVKPQPDGRSVRVHERPSATGSLRLVLTERKDAVAQGVSVSLVSNWGELVTVTSTEEAVALPVARYAVDALRFQLTDAKGRRWQYHFAGPRCFDIEVKAGAEQAVSVLSGLRLALELDPGSGKVDPGAEVYVTPNLRTPAGLYLVHCGTSERPGDDLSSSHADIRLDNTGGDTLAREQSGFL